GKLDFENLEFYLDEVVEGALCVLMPEAQAKGLQLRSEIDPQVQATLCGDPGRLRQVLTNLLNNAVKFTEHGEVVLRVLREKEASAVSHSIADSKTDLRFEIKDTGIGMIEDVSEHIFEDFIQADKLTNRL